MLGYVGWPSSNCSDFGRGACLPVFSNFSSGNRVSWDVDAATCPKYWCVPQPLATQPLPPHKCTRYRSVESGPCDLPWVCHDGFVSAIARSLVFASAHLIIALTATFRLLRSRRIPLLRAGFPGRIHALATIAAASFLRSIAGYLTMDPYLHPRTFCYPQNIGFLVVTQLLFNVPIILWCQVVCIMNLFWHSLLAAVEDEIVRAPFIYRVVIL